MASCPHVLSCPLFAVFTMNSSLAVWRGNYCTDGHTRCARYQLTLAGRPVPQNLLPNGKVLALAQPPGDPP